MVVYFAAPVLPCCRTNTGKQRLVMSRVAFLLLVFSTCTTAVTAAVHQHASPHATLLDMDFCLGKRNSSVDPDDGNFITTVQGNRHSGMETCTLSSGHNLHKRSYSLLPLKQCCSTCMSSKDSKCKSFTFDTNSNTCTESTGVASPTKVVGQPKVASDSSDRCSALGCKQSWSLVKSPSKEWAKEKAEFLIDSKVSICDDCSILPPVTPSTICETCAPGFFLDRMRDRNEDGNVVSSYAQCSICPVASSLFSLITKRWILYNVSTPEKCTSNKDQVVVDEDESAPFWASDRQTWMLSRRTWECTAKISSDTMVTEPKQERDQTQIRKSAALPPAWQTTVGLQPISQKKCEDANLLKDGYQYKYNTGENEEHEELKCSCIRRYKTPRSGHCDQEQVIDRAQVNFFLGALGIPRNALAASCTRCPSGRGGLWCSLCPSGFTSANQIHSTTIKTNKSRTKFLETRTCLQCAEGRYSQDPSVACKICASGLYSDVRGIVECKRCQRGFYYTPGESVASA